MAKPKKTRLKLEFAPSIDDPDEPDRMTHEQIKEMARGAARLAPDLVKKPDQKT